jgi:Phytanoyl-CoA dioxygenase (PhyH)
MDGGKLQQLDRDGYCILPGLMSTALVEQLRARVEELFASEGDRAGIELRQESGARWLTNLVDKGQIFAQPIVMDLILESVAHVLGADFKLSCLSLRDPAPNEGGSQPLHVDMGLLPDASGPLMCNTVWMLDDFTPENGAMRVVPGSHKWGRRPEEAIDDPNAIHSDEVLLTGKAGDVVVVNASVWHGGRPNRTSGMRRAMHGFYVRHDVPQHLCPKRRLSEDTQARLGPEVRQILALDDPLRNALPEWREVDVHEILLTETTVLSYIFQPKEERP